MLNNQSFSIRLYIYKKKQALAFVNPTSQSILIPLNFKTLYLDKLIGGGGQCKVNLIKIYQLFSYAWKLLY